jgi:hypothetical protein
MDWTGDGDFDDAGENIINNQFLNAGQTQVTFSIPVGTLLSGEFFARFRLYASPNGTDCSGVTPSVNGAATNGEVEDYVFDPGTPTAVTITNLTAHGRASALALALGVGGLLVLASAAYVLRRR